MDKFGTILSSFQDRWSLLSFNQKLLVGTLLLALMLSTFFLFQHSQDDYDVLYSNMSLPDAAATVAKLKEMKAPFKVADGGTTILVPRAQKNEMVLETASQLSSEQTINLTQIPPVVQGDVQKEWLKKLNTNAISNILRSIRGIKNAQVIVSQPEDTLFSDQAKPPTASVLLMVEPGFRLSQEQIKTIKNLVAHAVPALTPENVAIADNSGNPLEIANAADPGSSEVDVRRHRFEEDTTKKVLSVLSPIVGKENVVVSVSAMLNFDQAKSNIKRVIPTGGDNTNPTGLMVSTQEQSEEYTGKKSAAKEGGAAGVESNVEAPSYQGASGGDKGDYRSQKRTTNFVNSEEEKSVVYASGNVERMTISVVLNKVLTAQETDEIKETVANAAGIDFARGDSVDVKGFQFSQPPTSKEKELALASKAAQDQAQMIQIGSVAAVVLLGLSALVVFYVLFKRPVEGEIIEEEEPEPAPIYEDTQALLEAASPAVIEAMLDPEIEHMREALNNAIIQDPSEAARVLITYMKDL